MSNITNEELEQLLEIAKDNTGECLAEAEDRNSRQRYLDVYRKELAFIEYLEQRLAQSIKPDLTTNRQPGTTSHGELMRMQDEGEQ